MTFPSAQSLARLLSSSGSPSINFYLQDISWGNQISTQACLEVEGTNGSKVVKLPKIVIHSELPFSIISRSVVRATRSENEICTDDPPKTLKGASGYVHTYKDYIWYECFKIPGETICVKVYIDDFNVDFPYSEDDYFEMSTKACLGQEVWQQLNIMEDPLTQLGSRYYTLVTFQHEDRRKLRQVLPQGDFPDNPVPRMWVVDQDDGDVVALEKGMSFKAYEANQKKAQKLAKQEPKCRLESRLKRAHDKYDEEVTELEQAARNPFLPSKVRTWMEES